MAALIFERISVIAGMLTFYLVTTALLTVRRHEPGFNWMDASAMLFALLVALVSITFGVQGLKTATGNAAGYTPLGFIFGGVALLVLLLMFYWLARVLFTQ